MTHQLAHLSSTQIGAIDKSNAVVVQPIGAVEQHGPHLPVITDALTAERISERAVAALPDDANVWLLPTIHYGKSTEHLGWPGTIAMSTDTLLSVCLDLGRSVAASGFRKLVFVNGHGGQPSLLDVVARDIRVETGLEVFPLMPGRLGVPEGVEQADAGYGIHGGQHETSIVQALAPELVRMEHAVHDGQEVGKLYASARHLTLEGRGPTAWVTDDLSATGVLGDATTASRELGERLVAHQVTALAETLLEIRDFAFPEVTR